MTPAQIAKRANAACIGTLRYPWLHEDSARETVCQWLQVCDPNGCHTDERYQADFGTDELSYGDAAGAWEALAAMLADGS